MMSGLQPSVLLIDENISRARHLRDHLQKHHFPVQLLHTLKQSPRQLKPHTVLVLNLQIEADILSVLHTLKAKSPPIKIMVCLENASSTERTKVLKAGADDCLTWPCDLEELTTRLEVLGRNFLPSTHQLGNLTLHLITHRAEYQGKTIDLTPQECQLLYRLTLTPGTTLSRETLMEAIGDASEDINTRLIDVHIFKLRKKIHKRLITSVRGAGYLLNPHLLAENPSQSLVHSPPNQGKPLQKNEDRTVH